MGLLVAITVGLAIVVGAVSAKYLGNDNPVEEVAEAVIQAKTGINVDLSPSDPDAD